MLKSLKLTNFRKHTDTFIEFSEGLVVIRGENEAGKSTICEGILYAFFGSSTLRESLPEVVTYGQPENSLKAELVFEVDGMTAHITRGKSGAELHIGDRVVTGQNETKAAVERLLGCSAATAGLLMFADQNAIRGVLAESGSAASSLVEKLADLSVLENIVDAVQTQLPSGNTKAIDAQIATLKESLGTKPVAPDEPDFSDVQSEIDNLKAQISDLEDIIPSQAMVKEAHAKISDARLRAAEIEAAHLRKDEIREILSAKPVKPAQLTPDEETILITDPAELTRKRKAYDTVFPSSGVTWDGTEATLVAKVEELQVKVEQLTSEVTEHRSAIAVAKSKLVTDTKCPTCSQALPNAEAIVCINADLHTRINQESTLLELAQENLQGARCDLSEHQQVLALHRKVVAMASPWHILGDGIPASPIWSGPTPPDLSVLSDLKAKEAKIFEYQRAVKLRKELEKELEEAIPEAIDVSFEKEMLESLDDQKELLDSYSKSLRETEDYLAKLVQKHENEANQFKAKLEQYTRCEKQIAQLEGTVKEMVKHNELIKQLRGARPEIAAKLWGTVLGAISHYFTQARGEDSVVTRDAKGFKVNGRNVQGLSGSTQDMLGLSIRMALSKLFLPGVPFLLLDESFAGCSDTRELNGVSTLASAGFTQVLLITHSELPGQLADKVINL